MVVCLCKRAEADYNKDMNVTFLFFIFGLAIGSFLNVVVYRLKEHETILGRSFCRQCQHQIRWYDNIPLISFLFLRGKCRDCAAPISWHYPCLELVTALCFVLIGHYFFDILNSQTWAETLWLVLLVSLLLAMAVYDMIHMEIPLSLLIAGLVVTGVFLLFDHGGQRLSLESRLVQSVFGALVIGGFFFALVYISKETWMGWGDVWLGTLAGLIVGLPSALFLLTLSFGTGALISIGLMIFGDKGMKSQVPFAPYLVLGTLLALFLPQIFPDAMNLFVLL